MAELICGLGSLYHALALRGQEPITAAMRSVFARRLFVSERLSVFPISARSNYLTAASCLRTSA